MGRYDFNCILPSSVCGPLQLQARLSDMSGMGCAIGANWRTGMEDAIVTLNSLDEEELLDEFIACCSSRVWASQLVAARPYSGSNDLLAKSDASWDRVQADDVLEALAGHPMIGEQQLREKFASTAAWASDEQSGVSGASEETLQLLVELNQQYKDKFGYIFVICATGKSADEMAQACAARIPNSPDDELKIAAAQQNLITSIRLNKLLDNKSSRRL